MNPLQDDELDRALANLEAPPTPARLEARTLAAYRTRGNRWRRLLTMQVRVPLPAAVLVLATLVVLSVALARVESRPSSGPPPAWGGLQPVTELRPVVIRGQYEIR